MSSATIVHDVQHSAHYSGHSEGTVRPCGEVAVSHSGNKLMGCRVCGFNTERRCLWKGELRTRFF